MGTLLNQRVRSLREVSKSEADFFIKDVIELAKNHKIKVSEVIEAYKVLEIKRKNDLYVNNGDAFDEQMAGFGELVQSIGYSLSQIGEILEQK